MSAISRCATWVGLCAVLLGARDTDAQIVYVTTPKDVVTRMLELGDLTPGEVLYDLGSGDGRIPIEAARRYGVRAIGVEREPELIRVSRARARDAGLEELVTFREANLFDVDFESADVVTLYLLPTINQRLVPKLSKLATGSRIVSHQYMIPGMTADLGVRFVSEEDAATHMLYLYTTPLVGTDPPAGAEPPKRD